MGWLKNWRNRRAKKRFQNEVRGYLAVVYAKARSLTDHTLIMRDLANLRKMCESLGVEVPELEEAFSKFENSRKKVQNARL